MSRSDLAYMLIGMVLLAVVGVWFLSQRFARYEKAIRRGERHAKPVWKPFWYPDA